MVDVLPILQKSDLNACAQEQLIRKFQQVEKSLNKSFERCGEAGDDFSFSQKSGDAKSALLETVDEIQAWSDSNLDCKQKFTFTEEKASKLNKTIEAAFEKHQRREDLGRNCDATSALKSLDRNKQVRHKNFIYDFYFLIKWVLSFTV